MGLEVGVCPLPHTGLLPSSTFLEVSVDLSQATLSVTVTVCSFLVQGHFLSNHFCLHS